MTPGSKLGKYLRQYYAFQRSRSLLPPVLSVSHAVFHCLFRATGSLLPAAVFKCWSENTQSGPVFTVQPHRLKIPSPGSTVTEFARKHQEKQESVQNGSKHECSEM